MERGTVPTHEVEHKNSKKAFKLCPTLPRLLLIREIPLFITTSEVFGCTESYLILSPCTVVHVQDYCAESAGQWWWW